MGSIGQTSTLTIERSAKDTLAILDQLMQLTTFARSFVLSQRLTADQMPHFMQLLGSLHASHASLTPDQISVLKQLLEILASTAQSLLTVAVKSMTQTPTPTTTPIPAPTSISTPASLPSSLPIPGHIYLLREREFITLNQPVFKLGRSKQINRRLGEYPKGSVILMMLSVPDHITAEKKLLAIFDAKFKPRRDIGREYYEGSSAEMMKEMLSFGPTEPSRPAQPQSEDKQPSAAATAASVTVGSICPYSIEYVNTQLVREDDEDHVIFIGPKVDIHGCAFDAYTVNAFTVDKKTMVDSFRRAHPSLYDASYDNLLIIISPKHMRLRY